MEVNNLSTKHLGKRKIFYIDVGNLPKENASKYLKQIILKFKQK